MDTFDKFFRKQIKKAMIEVKKEIKRDKLKDTEPSDYTLDRLRKVENNIIKDFKEEFGANGTNK
jgi:hypothetical protein